MLKTKYDIDNSDLEKQFPDTSGLVKKIDYNAKIAKIENKVPNVSSLVKNRLQHKNY